MSTASTIPENASSLAARLSGQGDDNKNISTPSPDPGDAPPNKVIEIDSRNHSVDAPLLSPTQHDSNVPSTTPSPTAGTAISSTAASHSPYHRLNLNLLEEFHHPQQLSERDSIFATSYIPSDSTVSTPRPPKPRDDGSQDVDADLQLPPATVSGNSRSFQSAVNPKLDLNPGKASIGAFDEAKGSHSDVVRLYRPTTVTKSKSPTIIPRSQTTYQLQMSPSQRRQSDLAQQKLGSVDSPTDTHLETDDAPPRQEHRIEAVLTDEPAPHGRSRKASHYLGIFKEKGNVPGLEKSSKEKVKEVDHDQTQATNISDSTSTEVEAPISTEQIVASSNDVSKPFAPNSIQETSSQATSPLVSLFSHRSSLTETEDESISNLGENIEWRSSETGDGELPIRLLKNESKDGKIQISKSRQRADSALNVQEGRASPAREHEDEDEFSDKEHIASATYYPHEAPSPETAAQAKLLTEEQVRQTSPDLGPPARSIDLNQTISPILPDGTVQAWNLQSKAKVQHVEQEDVRPRRKSGKSERTRWSIVSVPSDTEYESGYDTSRSDKGYESALTDGGDLTPTGPSYISSAYPSRKPKKPLKAVELKPYKHQVGGHTKVFSFSKQAICKQLNNRENVFYEVVERRHPELLTFLPKYLGVLNVTYKKVLQRRKNEKTKVDTAKPNENQSSERHDAPKARPNEASPHTRMISHSSGFDKLDDAVPQVVYANNRHIIPDNLFRRRVIATDAARPVTSDGILGNVLSKIHSESGERTEGFKKHRPSLTKSLSAWGATMINTQLKEKVLREVFSPPQIYHRQRGRRRRSRNEFRSLRGQPEGYSDFAESSDVAVFSPTESANATEALAPKQSLIVPQDNVTDTSGIKIGSAPHSGQKSLSNLTISEKRENAGLGENLKRAKSVRRRRSGGGLRRKQNETLDGQRGEFEYYEEADVDPEKEDIFAMELLSQASPQLSQVDGAQSLILAGLDRSGGTSTGEATPIYQPVNPLEAQQSPDERVEHFLLLQDLTAGMSRPCVLDLKMGTRQYGIDASKKKQQSQRQKCKSTTSQKLGVRLCGMQVWNARISEYIFEDKYAGRDIRAGREFQDALIRFLSDGVSTANALRHIPPLLEKLSRLESIIVNLPGYRFYASSLLVLYDGDDRGQEKIDPKSPAPSEIAGKNNNGEELSSIDIRLVDFANCVTGEDKLPEDTPCPPSDRDGVDRGYIRGLKSLRKYLRRIWKEISDEQRAERGEVERREENGWGDEWQADDGNVSI